MPAEGRGDWKTDHSCRNQIQFSSPTYSGHKSASCLKTNPNNYVTWSKYGQALILYKHVDEAIYAFGQMERISPNEALPYRSLGDAYRSKGDYRQAIAKYKRLSGLADEEEKVYAESWIEILGVQLE